MKVVVREAAARDLDDILDWISGESSGAAAGGVHSQFTVQPELPNLPFVRKVLRTVQSAGTRDTARPQTPEMEP